MLDATRQTMQLLNMNVLYCDWISAQCGYFIYLNKSYLFSNSMDVQANVVKYLIMQLSCKLVRLRISLGHEVPDIKL